MVCHKIWQSFNIFSRKEKEKIVVGRGELKGNYSLKGHFSFYSTFSLILKIL